MTLIKVPLLALPNVVFFPKTALPIFVEAPAYSGLLKECAVKENPVIVSLAHIQNLQHNRGGIYQQLRPQYVGCVGIPYILDEMPNGAIKVLIKGLSRARLHSCVQNIPVPIYNVELIEESVRMVGNLSGQITHLTNVLESWVNIHVPNSIERESFLNGLDTAEHIANYVSMLLIRDCEVRQALLETDNLIERIQLLGALLRNGIPLEEDREVVGAIKEFEFVEKLTRAAN